MRSKLFKRPKAKAGAGRQAKIKHILVPEEVAEKLALFKLAYSETLKVRVTYEQMFRRWMENVGRFDRDVVKQCEIIREKWNKEQERMAEGLGISAEQLAKNKASYDPTEGDVWNLKYYFEKDGDELEAKLGDRTAFYASLNGRNIGMSALLEQGWRLLNEVGMELDIHQAWKINNTIKQHEHVD